MNAPVLPTPTPPPCIGNDPFCPCQDGLACHYRDIPGSPGWSLPTPTLDDLIRRAIDDHDAVGKIAHVEHMQPQRALEIAAKAVSRALMDWEDENGVKAILPPQMDVVAMLCVFKAGDHARDVADQLDLFETRPVYDGAAQHEARGELG